MCFIYRRMCCLMQLLISLSLVSLIMFFAASCNNANPGSSNGDDNLSPSTVTDIDGNIYNTVKIGNQVWTVENLRVTKYNDGSAIPYVSDSSQWRNLVTGAYCYYDNGTDAAYRKKWGALYNCYAIDTKKLAPKGWHVPTDAEWYTLSNYLIANGYNWDGTTTGSKIAKSLAANTDWCANSGTGSVGNDLSRNNSSGFSALPAGVRYSHGGFGDLYYCGRWWSSSDEGCSSEAFYRCICCGSVGFDSYFNPKCGGFSVRLLRD